jgi:CheY-like chemotaxis protein
MSSGFHLVVDDEEFNRDMLSRRLELEGLGHRTGLARGTRANEHCWARLRAVHSLQSHRGGVNFSAGRTRIRAR